jgi:hypothetical protein
MDQDATNVIAYCGFLFGVLTTIFTAINHKRCRSVCCGTKIDVSMDVEDTTPPKMKLPPPLSSEPPPYQPPPV